MIKKFIIINRNIFSVTDKYVLFKNKNLSLLHLWIVIKLLITRLYNVTLLNETHQIVTTMETFLLSYTYI